MKLQSELGLIEIVDERAYTFGSADNVRAYPFEMMLAERSLITSVHGIKLDGQPVAVFGASGGGTTVHEDSAIWLNASLYLAVGDRVVSLCLRPFRFRWALQTDMVTCFGVYFDPRRSALLSHGELEISRFSEEGQILWNASGADIFSEGFDLLPDAVKVTDFYGKKYSFDYETGKETVKPVGIAARLSWILPLAAWASQILSAIALGRQTSTAFWPVLMTLQGLAITTGLCLGIGALVGMARRKSWQGKRQAVAGSLISGMTMILILLAFLFF